jgi:prefoldin subunit 5
MESFMDRFGMLTQLGAVLVAAIWAISKIRTTTEILTKTIEVLSKTIDKLETTLEKMKDNYTQHEIRISHLEHHVKETCSKDNHGR